MPLNRQFRQLFETEAEANLPVLWHFQGAVLIWKGRFEKKGLAGLRDQPRRPNMIRYRIPPEIVALILRIREEHRYGAVRTSLYLQRHYHAYVSPTTVLKIFHRHNVGRISLKKYRPGPKPADAPLQVPGRSVQLDVKFVPRVGRARQRFYQFTAIDEATRYRILRVYDHNNTRTALDFLEEVSKHLPFAIQKIQTDNDSSFGPQFTWHLSDLGIAHRHIPPACPEVNGKVERSHKTDSEEFYRGRNSSIRKTWPEDSSGGKRSTTRTDHTLRSKEIHQLSESRTRSAIRTCQESPLTIH